MKSKLGERNIKRISLLQRLLHIQNLLIAIAVKERKKLYMAIYDKMEHVVAWQLNYFKTHKQARRQYQQMYNEQNKDKISENHKAYYKKNKGGIKERMRLYYLKKKENK